MSDNEIVTQVLQAIGTGSLAGVSAAASHTVTEAATRLRDGVVTRVKELFGDNTEAQNALTSYIDDPNQDNTEKLRPYLALISTDPTLNQLIQNNTTITATGPGSVAVGTVSQTITDGGSGFIGGTHSHS